LTQNLSFDYNIATFKNVKSTKWEELI